MCEGEVAQWFRSPFFQFFFTARCNFTPFSAMGLLQPCGYGVDSLRTEPKLRFRCVVYMLLRPRFTAMLWGCSMSLWPRILQHIGSKVDGEVSVAAMQLPAEAGPFLEAICALLLLYAARSAHPLTPRSASAEGVLCATKVYGARAVQTVATFQVSTSKLIVSITTS